MSYIFSFKFNFIFCSVCNDIQSFYVNIRCKYIKKEYMNEYVLHKLIKNIYTQFSQKLSILIFINTICILNNPSA